MATPTFILGDKNWGIKESGLLGATPVNNGYLQRALTFNASADITRTNSYGNVQRSPWNMIQYSEQFDNAAWVNGGNTTVSANVSFPLSPIQTQTVDMVNILTASAHSLYQIMSVSPNVTYTFSFYIYRGTATDLSYSVYNVSTPGNIVNPTSYFSQTASGIWSRISFSFTAPSGCTSLRVYPFRDGASTGTAYIWGAQLVEGSQPLDYLSTTNRLNIPRIDYSQGVGCLLLEPQRTNGIRNSTMVGAVAGTPGTLPTNWGESLNGLTRQVVGFGYENGIPYIDIKYSGTATGPFIQVNFEASTIITGTQNQAWTNSFYFKIVDATAPPTNYQLQINEFTNVGGYLNGGSITFSPTTTLARYSQVRSNVNATCAYVVPYYFSNITSGQTYNFTVRIAAPQMELGSYATTYIPTTTAAVTRIADTFSRSNIYTDGLISSAGGTWVVELRNNIEYNRDSTGFSIGIDSGLTRTNGLFLANNASFAKLSLYKVVSSSVTQLYTTTTATIKVAFRWNGATCDIFLNGSKIVSSTPFTITQMENFINQANIPIYIKSMSLYNTPLSDSECAQITANITN